MLAHTLQTTGLTLDQNALGWMATEPEAPLSDAPLPEPEGVGGGWGVLALGLLLSPKEPKETKRR
ncbi:hypothetical protein [Streptomyces albofaciens]|uniref:hypothetical protein n=1 Tax=Streptomyces albofaciens TaxID=66866 RepID=UPI001FCBE9E1|nr:hypothetical protein [Streptomyces albofaciens]